AFLREITCRVSGRGNNLHHEPVNQQQPDRDCDLCSEFRVEKNDRGEEVTDGDALQHTWNAILREPEIRQSVEKQADHEDDQRALDDLDVNVALAAAALEALGERERYCYADDEDEEWKDEIRGRPAVPLSVTQWSIHVFPRAGIVDKDHAGDRDAAKNVERHEPVGLTRNRRCWHRRRILAQSDFEASLATDCHRRRRIFIRIHPCNLWLTLP